MSIFLFCALSGICVIPRPLTNGRTSYTCTHVGCTVTYTCNTGYLMTAGSSSRTCLSNGQWSGSHPVCSRKSQVHMCLEIHLFTEHLTVLYQMLTVQLEQLVFLWETECLLYITCTVRHGLAHYFLLWGVFVYVIFGIFGCLLSFCQTCTH